MLCSKLHCQKGFDLIIFSDKYTSDVGIGGVRCTQQLFRQVQPPVFGVWGLGVLGSRFWVLGLGFGVLDSEVWVKGLGCRV